MFEFLETLSETPIPTILTIAGIAFLMLSVANKLVGQISVAREHRKQSMYFGLGLLTLGIFSQFAPIVLDPTHLRSEKSKSNCDNWRSSKSWNLNTSLNPSFSCAKLESLCQNNTMPQSELICMYSDLAKIDQEMGSYFRVYRNSLSPEQIRQANQDQQYWIIKRNDQCPVSWTDLETELTRRAKSVCLVGATMEHIKELKAKITVATNKQ